MRRLAVITCIFFCNSIFGQYYFNDIHSLRQGAEQYRLIRANKIKTITAVSTESGNTPTQDVLLEQEISMDGKKITITEPAVNGKKGTTLNTYELSRLKRAQYNSNGIDSKTDYTYDDKGRLQKIIFTTTDTAMRASSIEAHQWNYDEDGRPLSMVKTKNGTDTIVVNFIKDDRGNIAEEQWNKKGVRQETYYYYYNAKNELTDIVRYNNKLKKLLPDYLYEYDSNGRVTQMTQVSLASGNHLTWKYTYNDKGLKQKELCFDKAKQLVGSIEYTYQTFTP